MRVLVVEDDGAIQSLVSTIVSRLGFEVVRASTGDEALDHLRGGEYGAIVLDLMMPGRDGLALIEDIRAIAPDLLHRTIVITAAARLATSVEPHVRSVLLKPFEIDALTHAVTGCGAAH